MSIIANELKVGNVINHKNNVWKVISTEHVKPGKGGAFVQVTLRNLRTKSKLSERFRSQESVDKADCESVDAIFLFSSGTVLEVMTSDTFEQLSIDISIAGDSARFLVEGMNIVLDRVDGEIISIQLPDSVVLEVIETQPKMKMQTVTATLKPAKLSNGITIQVPQFVVESDKVRVKVETGIYDGIVTDSKK